MRRMKWIAAPIMMMVLLVAAIPIANAGVLWSGIDPIFTVNGQKYNVWIEWPEQYTCDVEDPIHVKVTVPKGSDYVFLSESNDDVGNCGSPQRTITDVEFEGRGKQIEVSARVKSSENFPVQVRIYQEGELARVYKGMSNSTVTGLPIFIIENAKVMEKVSKIRSFIFDRLDNDEDDEKDKKNKNEDRNDRKDRSRDRD